jgi:hypothetical protein
MRGKGMGNEIIGFPGPGSESFCDLRKNCATVNERGPENTVLRTVF